MHVISFLILHESKKPIVGSQMCKILSILLMRELKKPFASLQVYNIIFFSSIL